MEKKDMHYLVIQFIAMVDNVSNPGFIGASGWYNAEVTENEIMKRMKFVYPESKTIVIHINKVERVSAKEYSLRKNLIN